MEPLLLIRQAAMSNAVINCVDGFYKFGDRKYDMNTKTAFKRTHQRVSYYTMRDIIFFLEHVNTPMSEYRKLAFKAGHVAIVQADIKNLKSYLTGAVDDCEQIDHNMPSKRAATAAPSAEPVEVLSNDKIETLNNFRKRRRADPSCLDEAEEAEFLALDRAHLSKLRSDEYPASTRASMLQGSSVVDFGPVLTLFAENVLKPVQQPTEAVQPRDSAINKRTPIIIVPNSTSSCLTMLNACEFLRDGVFVSSDEKRKIGSLRESSVIFQRTDPLTGATKAYKLMDNAASLAREDWGRVVAVFVSGQTWQFKGWRWPNPVDLFKNVMGVYLTFEDRNVDANVQSWNCKTIKIKQFERHQDAGACMSFWKMLDDYVKTRKPSTGP